MTGSWGTKTLIRHHRECIKVKREDADWKIYHLIPPASPITIEDLAGKSGLDLPVVEDSLARLERSCLVERKGDEVRMLNFGEALIRNQLKYDEALPYTIENGVIKARK
jgi:Mn-dependent DtxR family transcriptional regulator